jgi:RND family efflux transporter MFP subunit
MKGVPIETHASEPSDLSRLKINWKEKSTSSPKRPKRKIKWVVITLFLVIGAFLAYRLLAPSAEAVEVTTVALINPSEPTVQLNASGYVVPQRRAAVASKATGRLVELRVKEGDTVRKGEIIARLESADVTATLNRLQASLNVAQFALAQAEAELSEATLVYKRRKALLDEELIPKAEFDAAEARYRRARANVSSAEAGVRAAEAAIRGAQVDVDSTNIRAPFDGTVLTRNAEVGEVVAPFGSSVSAKAAVVTIADMGSLQVEVDVSESNIEKIRVGQKSEITLDAFPETRYEGAVDTIVPTADRAKATILTKVKFKNRDARVLPEMSAKVGFLSDPVSPATQGEKKQTLAVEPGAIVQKGDKKVAFRIRGDQVEEVPVEAGGPIGGRVEIKKGLGQGDRVVMRPSEKLSAGDKVQIKPKDQ